MGKKILAISGSTRKNSTNEFILKAASGFFPEDWEIQFYNRIDELPYFNPDLVNIPDDIPEKVKEFYKLIEEADAVLICTPEYVFSLPGVLKNALEWTVSTTLFSYKPFAFIIASASGKKAFESMDLIMKTLLQEPVDENCKLLIKGVRGKINEDGTATDEQVAMEIKKVTDALVQKIAEGRRDNITA